LATSSHRWQEKIQGEVTERRKEQSNFKRQQWEYREREKQDSFAQISSQELIPTTISDSPVLHQSADVVGAVLYQVHKIQACFEEGGWHFHLNTEMPK